MQYFKDTAGVVHGFDETDPAQVALMGEIATAWTNITSSWPAPPSAADLGAYASSKAQELLATMGTYTSGSTVIKSDATASTLTDWMALEQRASANPGATTQWVANDNTVTALPASAVGQIAPLVGAFSLGIYQALATILTAITAGTITTTAEIDAASWPAIP